MSSLLKIFVILFINFSAVVITSNVEPAQNIVNLKQLKTAAEDILGSDPTDFQLPSQEKPWLYFRLTRNIVPIHYDIVFNPSLEDDVFNGNVNITVNVTKATYYFIVHENGLNISKSDVYDTQQNKFLEIKKRFHHSLDYFVLETVDEVKTGKYILSFDFSGFYKHGFGLYREEYIFSKNDKRHLAMTFFAPTFARRAFPCFDEPAFKATFSVGVFHDSTHFAISNMPVEIEEEVENNKKLTRFAKTPPMSTYLLCIVVCDFEYKEKISQKGIKIRAYASKNTIDKIETALTWTSEILSYFEDYLNVTYPLKKLDIISLPEFDANGMENWGLITYKEQSLLIDDTSSVTHKLEVAKLVAHELAHMWFGDLVTMDWWNETWLNEGFATHFAWKGAKHVLPEYFQVDDSGILETCEIMQKDDTIHTRPVIRSVREVVYSDVYSSIVYKKGAALLRMLEKFIKEDGFIKGVSSYLTKHAYGNVKSEYLWHEINQFTMKQGIDVSRLMHSWLTESNFPYINVMCQSRNNCSCEIWQHRFLLNTHNNYFIPWLYRPYRPYHQPLWNVPLSYRSAETTTVEYTVFNSEHKHILCNQSEWIKFNSPFQGYFPVKYSENEWKRFIRILKGNLADFNETDRLNLLFDAFTLASNDKISYVIPLNLTRYLTKEEYHTIWSFYLTFMTAIKGYLSDDKNTITSIQRYTKQLAKRLYRKYQWRDEGDFFEKKLRRQLIEAMCGNNDQACLEVAAQDYKKWMIGEMPDPEAAELVYKYGLKKLNDKASYNYMWNQYLNEMNPLLKTQYRDALSNVRKTPLLKKLFRDCRNRKYFRLSWQVSMIKLIAENDRGFPIVSSYIFKYWNNLVRKFGNGQAENIAETVFSKYQTKEDLQRVEEFYKEHPQAKKSEVRSRTLDNIRLRIKWKKKFQAQITEWFQTHSKFH